MGNQLTEDQKLDLIIKAMNFPKVGDRAKIKRNLVYMKTALGATWVPVEVQEEENV
jgi:hypothetical protein